MFQKKSLGQNFLKDQSALNKIVEAGKIALGETALEIGPGEGNLTKKLLEAGARVIAIEKDRRLIPILEKKFAPEISNGKLTLIQSDILTVDLSRFAIQDSRFKIVANIPYYITGQILRKFLEGDCQPTRVVLLIQKEVAERIVAKDEKESLLSISVKVYGQPKILGIVKAGAFSPSPKVDSAILVIENISKNNFSNFYDTLETGHNDENTDEQLKDAKKLEENLKDNERKFFQIIKAGFAHKRKKLAGNLKEILDEKTEQVFEKCAIDKKARAENLSVKKWLCLADF